MSICISHASADEVLEFCAHSKTPLEPASSNVLEKCTANYDEVHDLLDQAGLQLLKPVELLVCDSNKRRLNNAVACYTWSGSLPESSIKKIGEEIYVVSPELCLFQQASQLHVVALCQMLGRYLATRSPFTNNGTKTLEERSPLVSKEDVYQFLPHVTRHRGYRKLVDALRWTCSGAASPQETNLQLALTLPSYYGGFGFAPPHMNYEVPLSRQARRLCDKNTIRIDVCWPRKEAFPDQGGFGFEYQGEEHGKTLGEDYARCLAAHEMGYQLWYLAHEQLTDAEQMDYLARMLASKLHRKINERTWPSRDQVKRLLSFLDSHAAPAPIRSRTRRSKRPAV